MLGLDLSSLLPYVLTAIAVVVGTVHFLKKAASRFFVVDPSFDIGEGDELRRRMSIGGGDDTVCAACGRHGTKKCSRCKRVRYCSTACQSKHWDAEHKLKCKQARSSDKVNGIPSGDDAYSKRNTSISLVPARGTCKVLKQPKKILFPYDEFVKLFYWEKPGFLPCGLLNCGNSCFANVVLQCLASTRPLVAYLLERDHCRSCIRKQEDWCFLCELQFYIRRASSSCQPFSPTNILSRIPNIGGNFGYGSQEDAHEFMRFAIDTMQSVCLDEHGGEKALDASTQETTLIQYIFGGHLQSQVKCTKCNMISNRYENMMDLTVEIHGNAESLEECLDQFTAKECLDGDNKYKCDGCNDYVKAWKRLTVHQAPNILTITLKRFQSGKFGKLNKRVTFPEELDLSPYMSEDGDTTNLYSLYAIVVHIDMLNASYFGHYICYTKDYYGHWYRIDDCKVTTVNVEEVLLQGAYMLLYSRRAARREPFVKPTEPAIQNHLASRDIDLSSAHKEECVTRDESLGLNRDLASLSPEASSESNLSLLMDTGHDRLPAIRTSTIKGTEDIELEVPVTVNQVLIHKETEDANMHVHELSSLGSESCEEDSTSQPSHVQEDVAISPTTPYSAEIQNIDCEKQNGCEGGGSSRQSEFLLDSVATSAGPSCDEAQDMECELFGLSDARIDFKGKQSVSIPGETPHMPGYMTDTSLSNKMTAISSNVSVTPNELKSQPVMVEMLANNMCRTGGTKAVPSVIEKASILKQKPVFSRGFLDRHASKTSAVHEKNAPTHNPRLATSAIASGYEEGPNQQSHFQLNPIVASATSSCDEAQDMECEPFFVSDAKLDIKDNQPVFISGEKPHLSESMSDASLSSKISVSDIVNNMAVTSNASISSDELKSQSIVVEMLSNKLCRPEGTEVLPSVSENGSVLKPKPVFSHGFLDRHSSKASAEREKRALTHKPRVATSAVANGCEEGPSQQSQFQLNPTVASATPSCDDARLMEREPSCVFDAKLDIKDNRPVSIPGEKPYLSRSVSDASVSSKNLISDVNNMAASPSNASISSDQLKSQSVKVEMLVNDLCRTGETKALPSVSESGSFLKPKPLFSRGFLDRPIVGKSTECEKRAATHKPKVSTSAVANGYSDMPSQGGQNSSNFDLSFSKWGFLNNQLYKKPATELEVRQANCSVPAEAVIDSESTK